MNWRIIEKSEEDLLKTAANLEKDFPRFFRDSSNTWTSDEKAILAFYQHCSTLIGLFSKRRCEKDSFLGLVYFEEISEGFLNVHLDIKRGVPADKLIKPISEIRDYLFLNGLKICQTWALKRNPQIQQVLKKCGFLPTFLEMKFGFSHNRVLEWVQFCVAPNM